MCAAKVKDGLFIGDEETSKDPEFLDLNKISNLINVAGLEVANTWSSHGLVYLTYNWEDRNDFVLFDKKNGDDTLIDFIEFIDTSSRHGVSVLIFSKRGVGRAAVLAMAYLMCKYHWGFEKTYSYMNSKKVDIDLNDGFIRQLCILDKRIRSSCQQILQQQLQLLNSYNKSNSNNNDHIYQNIEIMRWKEWDPRYIEMEKELHKSHAFNNPNNSVTIATPSFSEWSRSLPLPSTTSNSYYNNSNNNSNPNPSFKKSADLPPCSMKLTSLFKLLPADELVLINSYNNSQLTITSLPGPYLNAMNTPKTFRIKFKNDAELASYSTSLSSTSSSNYGALHNNSNQIHKKLPPSSQTPLPMRSAMKGARLKSSSSSSNINTNNNFNNGNLNFISNNTVNGLQHQSANNSYQQQPQSLSSLSQSDLTATLGVTSNHNSNNSSNRHTPSSSSSSSSSVLDAKDRANFGTNMNGNINNHNIDNNLILAESKTRIAPTHIRNNNSNSNSSSNSSSNNSDSNSSSNNISNSSSSNNNNNGNNSNNDSILFNESKNGIIDYQDFLRYRASSSVSNPTSGTTATSGAVSSRSPSNMSMPLYDESNLNHHHVNKKALSSPTSSSISNSSSNNSNSNLLGQHDSRRKSKNEDDDFDTRFQASSSHIKNNKHSTTTKNNVRNKNETNHHYTGDDDDDDDDGKRTNNDKDKQQYYSHLLQRNHSSYLSQSVPMPAEQRLQSLVKSIEEKRPTTSSSSSSSIQSQQQKQRAQSQPHQRISNELSNNNNSSSNTISSNRDTNSLSFPQSHTYKTLQQQHMDNNNNSNFNTGSKNHMSQQQHQQLKFQSSPLSSSLPSSSSFIDNGWLDSNNTSNTVEKSSMMKSQTIHPSQSQQSQPQSLYASTLSSFELMQQQGFVKARHDIALDNDMNHHHHVLDTSSSSSSNSGLKQRKFKTSSTGTGSKLWIDANLAELVNAQSQSSGNGSRRSTPLASPKQSSSSSSQSLPLSQSSLTIQNSVPKVYRHGSPMAGRSNSSSNLNNVNFKPTTNSWAGSSTVSSTGSFNRDDYINNNNHNTSYVGNTSFTAKEKQKLNRLSDAYGEDSSSSSRNNNNNNNRTRNASSATGSGYMRPASPSVRPSSSSVGRATAAVSQSQPDNSFFSSHDQNKRNSSSSSSSSNGVMGSGSHHRHTPGASRRNSNDFSSVGSARGSSSNLKDEMFALDSARGSSHRGNGKGAGSGGSRPGTPSRAWRF